MKNWLIFFISPFKTDLYTELIQKLFFFFYIWTLYRMSYLQMYYIITVWIYRVSVAYWTSEEKKKRKKAWISYLHKCLNTLINHISSLSAFLGRVMKNEVHPRASGYFSYSSFHSKKLNIRSALTVQPFQCQKWQNVEGCNS